MIQHDTTWYNHYVSFFPEYRSKHHTKSCWNVEWCFLLQDKKAERHPLPCYCRDLLLERFPCCKKTLANKWVRNICSKDMPAEEFSQKTCTKYCFFSEMQSNYASFMTSRSNSDQTFNLHIKYIYIYTITWLDLTHDLNLNIYTYIYIYIHIYDQVKYGNFEKTWITWEDDWKVHSLSTPGRLYTYYIYIYIMSTLD